MSEAALNLFQQVWKKVDEVGDFDDTDASEPVDPELEAKEAIEGIKNETHDRAGLITSESFSRFVYLRRKWRSATESKAESESVFHECGIYNILGDKHSDQKLDMLALLLRENIEPDNIKAVLRVFRNELFQSDINPAWFYDHLEYFATCPLIGDLKKLKNGKLPELLRRFYGRHFELKEFRDFFNDSRSSAKRCIELLSVCDNLSAVETLSEFEVQFCRHFFNGRENVAQLEELVKIFKEIGPELVLELNDGVAREIMQYRPSVEFVRAIGTMNIISVKNAGIFREFYNKFSCGGNWEVAAEFVYFFGREQTILLYSSRYLPEVFGHFCAERRAGRVVFQKKESEPEVDQNESQKLSPRIPEANPIEKALSEVLENVTEEIVRLQIESAESRTIPISRYGEVKNPNLFHYLAELNKFTDGPYAYSLKSHPAIIDVMEGGNRGIEGSDRVEVVKAILDSTVIDEHDDVDSIEGKRKKANALVLHSSDYRGTPGYVKAWKGFINAVSDEGTYELVKDSLEPPQVYQGTDERLERSTEMIEFAKVANEQADKDPEVHESTKRFLKEYHCGGLGRFSVEEAKTIFGVFIESDENCKALSLWAKIYPGDKKVTNESILSHVKLIKSGYWFINSRSCKNTPRRNSKIFDEIAMDNEMLSRACAFFENYPVKVADDNDVFDRIYAELLREVKKSANSGLKSPPTLEIDPASASQCLEVLFRKFRTGLFEGLQRVPRNMAKVVEEVTNDARIDGRGITSADAEKINDRASLATIVEPKSFVDIEWEAAYLHLLKNQQLRGIFINTLRAQFLAEAVEGGELAEYQGESGKFLESIKALEVIGRCLDIWYNPKVYYAEEETLQAIGIRGFLSCKNPEQVVENILKELNPRTGVKGRPMLNPQAYYEFAIKDLNQGMRKKVQSGLMQFEPAEKSKEKPKNHKTTHKTEKTKPESPKDIFLERLNHIVRIHFDRRMVPRNYSIPPEERVLAFFMNKSSARSYIPEEHLRDYGIIFELFDRWNSFWYLEPSTFQSIGMDVLCDTPEIREKISALIGIMEIFWAGERVPSNLSEKAKKVNHAKIKKNNARVREYLDEFGGPNLFQLPFDRFVIKIKRDLKKDMIDWSWSLVD